MIGPVIINIQLHTYGTYDGQNRSCRRHRPARPGQDRRRGPGNWTRCRNAPPDRNAWRRSHKQQLLLMMQ